jgi:CRISPR-associated endonuclease/helicase Cas3
MDILAKKRDDGRYQTLEEHTQSVLEEALNFVKEDDLSFVAQKTKYNRDRLKDLIFYSVYFHDIGKATIEFQNTILHGYRSYHSLYSASLVADIPDFELSKQEWLNLLFLIIITHHSLYAPGIFAAVNETKKYFFNLLPESKKFFYLHNKYYQKIFMKSCPYKFTYKQISLSKLQRKIDYHLKDDLRHIPDKEKLRLLYYYVLGILNLADWIASAKFSQKNIPKITYLNIPQKSNVLDKLSETLKPEVFNIKDFQRSLYNTKGSILVEIPTGEGKTEGSFLWAMNNLKNINEKIIYTLPTQTTSNKLFERVRRIFKDCSGLVHGSAKLYLEDLFSKEDGYMNNYLNSELLFSKVFCKPFTVSTIDSLLKYFLNVGKYSIAMFNIFHSLIIIDEVHSYDYKLMGFIKRFLELARESNIHVCIMSASIPERIKEKIGITNYPLIKDNELFKKKPNYIYKVKKFLNEDVNKIKQKYLEGKNILIVRNTVRNSIDTYKLLKKAGIKNIVLYNSNFKKIDRVKKENEIYEKLESKNQFILVATQVVEISLDIDFDLMFTDTAPIDSLIQRFGRVNRKKDEFNPGSIYIYSKTDIKPYYDYLLEISFKTIKEGINDIGEYVKWLNIVYDKLFEDIKHKNEFEKLFHEGYEAYNKYLQYNDGISQFKDTYSLRDNEFPKVDFILKEDYENNNYNYDNTVSLGTWLLDKKYGYLLAEKDLEKGRYYDVLNFEYTYELGVIIPQKDEAPEKFL